MFNQLCRVTPRPCYGAKILTFLESMNSGEEKISELAERFSSMGDLNRSINIGLKEIGKEIGVDGLQFYAARHSMATIAANEAGIDRWTVNLMLNHTDQSMRVTELYIKRDFSPVNEANYKLIGYVFGEMEGGE